MALALQSTPVKKRRTRWTLLLVLPYLGLCFPQLYARTNPALWGFPFFYWYQFAWVILAAMLMGIVYFKLRNEQEPPSRIKARRLIYFASLTDSPPGPHPAPGHVPRQA